MLWNVRLLEPGNHKQVLPLPRLEASNHQHRCKFRTTKMIEKMVRRRVHDDEWQKMSMYNIKNAFNVICMGGTPRGIFGISPVETLHQIKKGLMQYQMEDFNQVIPAKIRCRLDQIIENIYKFGKHSGQKGYPRVNYTRGCMKTTNIKAEEMVGQMMIMVLICSRDDSREILLENLSKEEIDNHLWAFEKLLVLVEWAQKEEQWSTMDIHGREKRFWHNKLRLFMRDFKERAPRTKGTGLDIQKFHELLHWTTVIEDYGSLLNVDSGPGESNHRFHAKSTARRTRMSHATFNADVANRISEKLLILTVYDKMLNNANFFLPSKERVEQEETDAIVESLANSHRFFVGYQEVTTNSRKRFNSQRKKYRLIIEDQIKQSIDVSSPGDLPPKMRLVRNHSLYFQERRNVLHPDAKRWLQTMMGNENSFPACGYTCYSQYKREDTIFCCHSKYRGVNCWYDWVMCLFSLERHDGTRYNQEFPARLLCIFTNADEPNGPVKILVRAAKKKKEETQLTELWEMETHLTLLMGDSLVGHIHAYNDDKGESSRVRIFKDRNEWHEEMES